MKKIIIPIFMVITMCTAQVRAYTVCNRSQTPITVIVCQTQDKAVESLRAMGWDGPFPHKNQKLQHRGETFNLPTIYVALHWLIEPGKCDGTNWRDMQKNLDEKKMTLPNVYFMIFEAFDKTGSTAIHFLTSGSASIDSTINFPNVPKKGRAELE